MYSDMIAGTRTFNIRIAELFGLETAVYLNCILEMNYMQSNASILNLNRNFISRLTTLDNNKQIECQDKLCEYGIVKELTTADNIMIDSLKLSSLFNLEGDQKTIISKDVKATDNASKESSKQKFIANNVIKAIQETDPSTKVKYADWVRAVVAKYGTMTQAQLQESEQQLKNYTKNNLILQKEILIIAIKNSYRDISWAINAYEKNKPAESKVALMPESRVVYKTREMVF